MTIVLAALQMPRPRSILIISEARQLASFAGCGTAGAFNHNSAGVGESLVVAGKRKIVMPVPNSNTKKAIQKQSSESEEEISESEEEKSSEPEEEGHSMDMPQEGHKIPQLKSEETKGRAGPVYRYQCVMGIFL